MLLPIAAVLFVKSYKLQCCQPGNLGSMSGPRGGPPGGREGAGIDEIVRIGSQQQNVKPQIFKADNQLVLQRTNTLCDIYRSIS